MLMNRSIDLYLSFSLKTAISSAGSGTERTYSFSLETKFSDKDFAGKEEKTASWKVGVGESEGTLGKTFADFDGSMQAYSRAKSGGYHEETIRAGGDYTLRNYLYDAVGQNSLEEFLLKNVLDPQKPSFREAIADLIAGQLETLGDGAFIFKYGDDEYELKALGSTAKDPENANTVTLQLVHMASGSTLDIGTVLPDLLPEFAERLIRKIDEELEKPDWKTNNYGTENKLINEMVDLLVMILRSVVMTPLDENDPDSTVLRILNDGNLTYCRGDEALASDEQKAKWDARYGLISGKRLRAAQRQYPGRFG